MPGTRFSLEVQPVLPERLKHLTELANDLVYSWDRQVRELFFRLDQTLWEKTGHNPKVFLRRVAQEKLEAASGDRVYIQDYNRVLSAYRTYLRDKNTALVAQHMNPEQDLVAYFCLEFGFHESFPIYSGGLGILAGDHCKAASDLGLPFVAVGLLYRQGYFQQTINAEGTQLAHYRQTDFADLPIVPAVGAKGEALRVHVELPGRNVELQVWHARSGHINLYLLDSDLPSNSEEDRSITYQLYGGDAKNRIRQEIVLGVGGVKALRALNLEPSVWHINEGHAAFQVLERCREWVEKRLEFGAALELVACNTVFTSHTPVPAGHDIFDHGLLEDYLTIFADKLKTGVDEVKRLGASPSNETRFNMTALALRGSRFQNGVSRIHGDVVAKMESYVWPQILPDENPMGYVTNGVHVPTFLANEWVNLFDMKFGGGWRNELLNESFWLQIEDVPDHSFWSIRQSLKAKLLEYAHRHSTLQHQRNGCSESQIERLTRLLRPKEADLLIIGFARRFATYKRATLIFSDPERLARLLNDPERPVLLIFAGKAHPNDEPGQHLIKTIHDYSRMPEFEGRVVLLESYDLAMSRKLLPGVDVWLNTPEYPLEASGTSGQKAGINGTINLSVTDGWWAEGYNGQNGWAITPHGPQFDSEFRNREESSELLDLLEHEVIPMFFAHDGRGYSEQWVTRSKAAMKSLIPRFSSMRMLMDYVAQLYSPAAKQLSLLAGDGYQAAQELAGWKQKVRASWHEVSVHRVGDPGEAITAGSSLPLKVAVGLNGLDPEDITVECVVGTETDSDDFHPESFHIFQHEGSGESGEAVFSLQLEPTLSGQQYYKIRVYPHHRLLSRRFETGRMLWV